MQTNQKKPTLREYLHAYKRKRSASRSQSKNSDEHNQPQTFQQQIEDLKQYITPLIYDSDERDNVSSKMNRMYDTYLRDTSSRGSSCNFASQYSEPIISQKQSPKKKELTDQELSEKMLAAGEYYLRLRALRSRSAKRLREHENEERSKKLEKRKDASVHQAEYTNRNSSIVLTSILKNKPKNER